jgi:hypothetical protein
MRSTKSLDGILSLSSADRNVGIRGKSILTTLAITLIATAPAWSQSLLKRLDPDNDGTVDLAEAKSAASKLFDKLDRDGTLDKRERGRTCGHSGAHQARAQAAGPARFCRLASATVQ